MGTEMGKPARGRTSVQLRTCLDAVFFARRSAALRSKHLAFLEKGWGFGGRENLFSRGKEVFPSPETIGLYRELTGRSRKERRECQRTLPPERS